MQKVRYINPKGESIFFDIKPPFILQKIDGTGNVDAHISSQKSPYQDGATYLNTKLDIRDIFMQVTLLHRNQSELFRMRQELQRVFNPKLGEGFLIYETPYGTKMIKCIPDGTPSFGEYKATTVSCQINLIAHNPLWTDLEVLGNSAKISNYIDKYDKMPTLPYFSIVPSNAGTTVMNNGTFSSSLVIEISGETTENVIVSNDTMGEQFEIIRAIPEGSKLHINTGFGRERVVKLISIDGTETNGFPYLSFHSKFIQLEVGENRISYKSNQDVEINVMWHNNYIGL